MATVDTERWRNYFGKAGADIWTVIHHALNIAAVDYPTDFRERRGEIAETLFARNLLNTKNNGSNHDSTNTVNPDDVDDLSNYKDHRFSHSMGMRSTQNVSSHGDATLVKHQTIQLNDKNPMEDAHSFPYQRTELSLGESDALLVRDINHIKSMIMNEDQPENVVMESLERLQFMKITVGVLKETEIGRHVKILKKHPSKKVRAMVKDLVRDWKTKVDEWANRNTDNVPGKMVNATGGDIPDTQIHEARMSSQLGEECEYMEAGVGCVDVSKLFSFIDGEFCIEDKDSHRHSSSVEPSVKDNTAYLSSSQSGSMLTDSSDFDVKASTNHPWGLMTPEERGSVTRDVYPPGKFEREASTLGGHSSRHDKGQSARDNRCSLQEASKGSTSGSSAQQHGDVAKLKLTTEGRQVQNSRHVVMNNAHIVQRPEVRAKIADKSSLMKSDKTQIDHKLEIAKRKLHQGYQQAENAKKQRVVQMLELPDGVKAGQAVKGKANLPGQSKGVPLAQNKIGYQNSHRNLKGRFC
ncbi:hypothetical protein KP509_30G031900 [Ceratopteris richardii]|uniref:TFIIS N-terminal domain-containing protein n=1 Tax=Ceratopteris richardii TaxID=49495 RepID=A0A8T2R139_CERRI|nr:hypothetical protein KP509_30G031900 [Ceratopteris richardii]